MLWIDTDSDRPDPDRHALKADPDLDTNPAYCGSDPIRIVGSTPLSFSQLYLNRERYRIVRYLREPWRQGLGFLAVGGVAALSHHLHRRLHLTIGQSRTGTRCTEWRQLVPSPQLQIIHPCGLKLPMSSSRTPLGLGATLEATARLLTRNDGKLAEQIPIIYPDEKRYFSLPPTIPGNK